MVSTDDLTSYSRGELNAMTRDQLLKLWRARSESKYDNYNRNEHELRVLLSRTPRRGDANRSKSKNGSSRRRRNTPERLIDSVVKITRNDGKFQMHITNDFLDLVRPEGMATLASYLSVSESQISDRLDRSDVTLMVDDENLKLLSLDGVRRVARVITGDETVMTYNRSQALYAIKRAIRIVENMYKRNRNRGVRTTTTPRNKRIDNDRRLLVSEDKNGYYVTLNEYVIDNLCESGIAWLAREFDVPSDTNDVLNHLRQLVENERLLRIANEFFDHATLPLLRHIAGVITKNIDGAEGFTRDEAIWAIKQHPSFANKPNNTDIQQSDLTIAEDADSGTPVTKLLISSETLGRFNRQQLEWILVHSNPAIALQDASVRNIDELRMLVRPYLPITIGFDSEFITNLLTISQLRELACNVIPEKCGDITQMNRTQLLTGLRLYRQMTHENLYLASTTPSRNDEMTKRSESTYRRVGNAESDGMYTENVALRNEIGQLRQSLLETSAQLNDVRAQLDVADLERRNTNDRLQEKLNDIAELQSQLTECKSYIYELDSRLRDVDKERARMTAAHLADDRLSNASVGVQLDRSRRDVNLAKSETNALVVEVADLKSQLNRAEMQINTQRATIDALTANLNSSNSKALEMKEMWERSEYELSASRRDAETCRKTNDNLEIKMMELQNLMKVERARAQTDLEKCQAELQQRIESEAALVESLQRAKLDLVTINSVANKVNRNSGVGNAINDRLNKELNTVRREKAQVQSDLDVLRAQHDRLTNECQAVSSRYESLMTKYNLTKTNVQQQRIEFEAVNDALSKSRSDVVVLRGRISELVTQLQETNNQRDAATAHKNRLLKEHDVLERHANDVRRLNNELETSLTEERQLNALNLRRLQDEIKTYQQEMAQLRRRLDESNQRIQAFVNSEQNILAAGTRDSSFPIVDADNTEQLVVRLKNKLKSTMLERNELAATVNSLQMQATRYEALMSEQSSNINDARAYRDQREKQHAEFLRQIDSLRRKNVQLQTALQRLNEVRISNSVKNDVESKKQMGNVTQEIAQRNAEITNLQNRYARCERSLAELRNVNDTTLNELAQSRSDLQRTNEMYAVMEAELEASRVAYSNLEGDMQKLQLDYMTLQQRTMGACTAVGDVNECARALLEVTDNVVADRVPVRRLPVKRGNRSNASLSPQSKRNTDQQRWSPKRARLSPARNSVNRRSVAGPIRRVSARRSVSINDDLLTDDEDENLGNIQINYSLTDDEDDAAQTRRSLSYSVTDDEDDAAQIRRPSVTDDEDDRVVGTRSSVRRSSVRGSSARRSSVRPPSVRRSSARRSSARRSRSALRSKSPTRNTSAIRPRTPRARRPIRPMADNFAEGYVYERPMGGGAPRRYQAVGTPGNGRQSDRGGMGVLDDIYNR
ncbi:DNA metabolism protein [Heliothis virescens ascovirus 3f]|uniref:DNA metabolism protein n=1 Tax=Heliothis virescens ascovirus 3f TaxID=328614 RepID=A0A171PVE9_9VIRU|nr:DNA metabolism protein [Heliothis virescens ascovirus 3f]AJP09025.1 DNA metabolism protein [Heliothis virescens ascovirus 3f]